jgi:N-methylhydantoinase B
LVLDAAGAVDAAATASLRERLRGARVRLVTVIDGAVFEPGAVSRRRICRLNPADAEAAGVGEDDVVELDTATAAPLRAWARIEAGVKRGTVPIDDRALSILQIAAGDGVELRRVTRSLRPRIGFAEAAE